MGDLERKNIELFIIRIGQLLKIYAEIEDKEIALLKIFHRNNCGCEKCYFCLFYSVVYRNFSLAKVIIENMDQKI